MRFQDILMMTAQASGGATWTPLNLGASLLAWWDAERADLITAPSNAVSSWKDIIGGYDLTQSTGASKPAYQAAGFSNGRPCIRPDGGDDYLELAGGFSGLPAGASPSEAWYVVDQLRVAASAGTLEMGSWGSTANSNSRRVNRTVVGGVNQATSLIGAVTVTNTADFSGRHVVRVITSGTTLQVDVDGVAGTPSACVPVTIASRIRLFANSPVTPSVFGDIRTNSHLITGLLSAGQATSLYGFLNGRIA